MKCLRLASALLAVAFCTANGFAQLNSPDAAGYLLRARKMLADNNPVGCLDQISKLKTLNPTSAQIEEASLLEALAAVAERDAAAPAKLKAWIADCPASPLCGEAALALANSYFDSRKYSEALDIYNNIDEESFSAPDAQNLNYHKAYSYLALDDIDSAEALFTQLSPKGAYGVGREFGLAYIAYARGDYKKALPVFKSLSSNAEFGTQAKYYIAQIDFVEHRFEEALANAASVIASKAIPEYNAEACRIAGESLFNLGRESEAIPYLKNYVREVGEDIMPSTAYILGVSEYHTGNYGGAATMFKRVTSQDDAMGQSANLYLGQCYVADGNATSALMAFEKAFKMNFDKEVSEEALYNYAVAKSNGGRLPFGNSVALFENFLTSYPQSKYASEVERYILDGYMSDNDFENVLRVVGNMKRPSKSMLLAKQRALFMAGTRDYSAGKVAEALRRFAEAATMSPSDAAVARQSLLWQGICMYDNGNYDGAASCFNRYLSGANSKDVNALLARYNLAYSQFASDKYAAALGNFRTVASGNASNEMKADAYSRIGDCLYYSSKFAEAADNYDKAFSLNPSAGDYPMYQQAVMLGLQRKHSEKIHRMDEMIQKFPASALVPAALLEKAEAYAALGNMSKTIEVYNTLLDKYGSTAYGRKGMLQLAITYLNTGDRKSAVENYKKVITTYPTSEEAVLAIDDLKRIYAEDGGLQQFVQFMATVQDAPSVNPSELDALSFRAAESDYINEDKTERLNKYLSEYPKGIHEAQALFYLAEAAYNKADYPAALSFSDRLLGVYPDASAAEDAMLIKAESEMALGKGELALETFRTLSVKATGTRNLHNARIGYMRSALALGENAEVVAVADALLSSSAGSQSNNSEIKYSKALALNRIGNSEKAREIWSELAVNPTETYGARSAIALAESLVADGKSEDAAKIADEFINSNPPHAYWLARGFIVLSDALRAQGETFEADEYLRTLKENYPGSEADIFEMIEKRLK
ncbi:MAG: tetratricopeptide repeat protein [Paramuribaculum sp.]|nr:tetratricopeptide repeat protein [Paramuribaculum sp.]